MSNEEKSILITGASTGIGRSAAEYLSSQGWRVFAGVRHLADAPEEAGAIELDVTSQSSIKAALDQISSETGGRLDAVVNNAGIPVTGAIETIPSEDFRRIVDTNLIGHFEVTKAALPLIRAAKGRVVFVTSLGGRVAFPFAGAYHATKFGVEGMAESLRAEMRPLDVDVVVVEPGSMSTEIWGKGLEHLEKVKRTMSSAEAEVYGEELDAFGERLSSADDGGEDAEEVAKTIGDALTDDRPNDRYLVGRGARTATFLQSIVPPAVFDRVKTRLVTPN